jgi:cytochrome P450
MLELRDLIEADWHDTALKPEILKLVAQLSSKVFLGDQICRNPDWIRITVEYTVHSFLAAETLRLWPRFMRRFVAPFLPSCKLVRKELQEAQNIISPVLQNRREAKQKAVEQGKEPERYLDSLQWVEDCAKGRPYNAAVIQLIFSVAAIHTTTDLLCQVLYDLCGKEDLIQALREEVVTVIGEEQGWKKATLYKLKLMDSTLKESQRLKPIGIGTCPSLLANHAEDFIY